MPTRTKKTEFPVSEIRRFLEPGPIVLLSTSYKGQPNVMTLGWHTVLEFEPALIGFMVTSANYSFELLKKSKSCVINIPEVPLLATALAIGQESGSEIDKFGKFGLTYEPGKKVSAPVITECHTNIECELHDAKLVKSYNFFIWKAVYAQAKRRPKYPKTFHYRGDGVFMISGENKNMRHLISDESIL